ncbi:MAG: hypothetical protein PCFJNLEI_03844 [Verrucomicrobiae bacterium]|nr:hypothetical protein [Verrucomicrobiae bacterium]
MKVTLGLVWLIFLAASSHAAVKPHGLFSNGGVLQQGVEVPVWGTANTGDKVTVKFQGQEVSTVAQEGRWLVKLKPLKPGGPFTMHINDAEITDLLIGEVWVCSGQSNMHFPLKRATTGPAAIAAATDSELRLCTIPNAGGPEPLRDVAVQWKSSTPTNVADFSAIGYFFGRDLRRARQVPVGLIHSSVGGTGVQFWMSWRGIEANPAYQGWVDAGKVAEARYQAALTKYQQSPGTNPPPKRVERTIGKVYNGMIAPLQPYAIRGVIWFQGESNSTVAQAYAGWFLEMLRGWRADWGQGDFPFLVGQLGPFVTPEIREAQVDVWRRATNTALVVSADCLEGAREVHFPEKEPVGQRLALAARAVAYGETVEYAGPVFDSMRVEGDRVVLNFQNTDAGLTVKGQELTGFTIAGADKVFTNATAKITGTQVIVSSPLVPEPIAVRYGWAVVPKLTLYNQDGLPASPFRTDKP